LKGRKKARQVGFVDRGRIRGNIKVYVEKLEKRKGEKGTDEMR